MNENLEIAIKAAIEGGEEIMKIYEQADIIVKDKADQSPLTEADEAANRRINSYLKSTVFPVISEENKQLKYSTRKGWDHCWIVDPLDGTKEFIKKNGEFTVNIALCAYGSPILGVIYVPVTRELYYADVSMGLAYKTIIGIGQKEIGQLYKDQDNILPSKGSREQVRVIGSRSHMNQETLHFIEGLKKTHSEVAIVSKGSSLKFCLLAEGLADIYPRFAPTMEWDTAAGHAICKAAGLKVISRESNKELEYNKSNLLNPHFLVSN